MKQYQEFEIALRNLRAEVVCELSTMAIYKSDTDDWEIKTDSASIYEADESLLADAAELADNEVATLAELESQYRHIELALGKIKIGSYGICEISGKDIEVDRLKANPTARTGREHMNDESLLPL